MNKYTYYLLAVAVMAIVTYLTRVIPIIFCKKKLTNKYIQSFLTYLPCGVLAAMVFPDIFYSTASLVSAIIGTIVAIILAYFRRGLLTVALGGVLTVFIVEQIMLLI